MGAEITGHGTDVIEVKGVKSLRGVSYSALPDRIETGTFCVAAVLTKGSLKIKGFESKLIKTELPLFVLAILLSVCHAILCLENVS